MTRRSLLLALWASRRAATSQVIDFESGGLKYKTLTRNGLTIMYAHLPAQVREYSIIQVAVSNGSSVPWVVRTEDFVFEKPDGTRIKPSRPRSVVNELVEKAGKSDVIKLVATYEIGLYGLSRLQSTNGYEIRRQNAFAELTSAKLKAAAAASAIAFVDVKLKPGESTDGAIFFANQGKPLGYGKLLVRAAGELFEFPSEPIAP
ncbi:MAG: hypothetical protein NZV14_18320 [Bryobacteraceae bacterium]|nr:hypothetical protein [Bryobacteraceae bacterium]MDW8380122.1 hypothetical protein [Bryobacterales bacterium]